MTRLSRLDCAVPKVSGPLHASSKSSIWSTVWSVEDFWVTFPKGWTVQYGHVFARHPDRDDEFGFYAVTVDEVYADACRGERGGVVTVGPAVNDLVDALLEQPGTSKRGPVDTRMGNYPAVRIDLSIPPRMQQRNCFMGPGTGLQVWYSEPTDKHFVLLPGAVGRVYVVDVVGERQVFLAQVGTPSRLPTAPSCRRSSTRSASSGEM